MLGSVMELLQQDICMQVLSVYNYHTLAVSLGTSNRVSTSPGFGGKTNFDLSSFAIEAALS
jgi:hypothetical protein